MGIKDKLKSLNAEDITGSFKPKVEQTVGNIKSGIKSAVSGANDLMTDIGENALGITSIGGTAKSLYNTKQYENDEAHASGKLTKLENKSPGSFQISEELKGYKDDLSRHEGNAPDAFDNKYQAQIDALLDKMANQKPFSYDFASDPTWQTLSDQYKRNALLGMQSAMGEAAGLTGGYGSSYAQQVGQQTYQQNISEMTDIIPELAGNALNIWQANNNQLASNLSALQSQQSADYSRYYNDWQIWNTDRNYLYQKVMEMTDQEFNEYLSDVNRWQADRNFYAEQKQAAVANQQFEQQFRENQRQFNQQMMFNYVNMGVGAAVDITTAAIPAAVDLIGIGADTALGVGGMIQDQYQFDKNLEYDYAALAEDRRQFDFLHPQSTASTQAITSSSGLNSAKKSGSGTTKKSSSAKGSSASTGVVSTQSVDSYASTKSDEEMMSGIPEDLRLYLRNSGSYKGSDTKALNEQAIRTAYAREENGITDEQAKYLINKYVK